MYLWIALLHDIGLKLEGFFAWSTLLTKTKYLHLVVPLSRYVTQEGVNSVTTKSFGTLKQLESTQDNLW